MVHKLLSESWDLSGQLFNSGPSFLVAVFLPISELYLRSRSVPQQRLLPLIYSLWVDQTRKLRYFYDL